MEYVRIVIPSRFRKMLGIEGESEVLVRVEGNRIVIEPPREGP